MNETTRRQWLTTTTVLSSGLLLTQKATAKETKPTASPFRYCLNTSTIRQKDLDLEKKIEIAAKAGYQGIEPWIREIQDFQNKGGKLKDLAKKIRDHGLKVESAIGFAQWIVDDNGARTKALEQAKHDMDLVKQLGGSRIAAPPTGATNRSDLDLRVVAERYRALLKVGDQIGVIPQLEVWGFSKALSKLAEVAFVVIESGHPRACMLPDIYHLYKGGNSFDTLKILSGQAMHVFHVNDYPGKPARDKISDRDRVHVGDGVAPIRQIFNDLFTNGFRGALSLELFNPNYWKQDPLEVAKTGLKKIKLAVEASLKG